MHKSVDLPAALAMLVLCALWGTQQVAIKLATPDIAPVLQIGIRSGLAAAIVLLVIFLRRESSALRSGVWRSGLVVGALFGLEFVLFAEGLRFTSASHMSIFLYTAPIFAAVGLHFKLLEERLAPLQWVGIVVAFGGIGMTFAGRGHSPAGDASWIGDLLGMVAGAAWGATTIVVRTSSLARAPAAVTLWYQLMGGCVIGLAAALGLGDTQATMTAISASSLVYQTVILSVGSYLAWFSLLRTYLASRLGVLTLMTPVFGIGFGIAVLGDTLTREFIYGTALILGGILLVNGQDVVLRWRTEKPIPAPQRIDCGERSIISRR